MSLIPSDRYPGQIDSDAGYPQGKARNSGSFQDGTGTPLEKDWVNDIWGFLQALLAESAITPSGDPDEVGASQYLEAVQTLIAAVPGRLLTRTVLDSGSSTTFNHHADAKTCRIRGIGAGAAAGGAAAAAGSFGSGGGSGTYGEKTFSIAAPTSTYTVGAAGAGVSANNGNDGGDSTWTHDSSTVTLPGGKGGIMNNSGAAVAVQAGGAGGGAATGADYYIPGAQGRHGFRPTTSSTPCFGGEGAASFFGAGGKPGATSSTVNHGGAGNAPGAGGGGEANGFSTGAATGAAGNAGLWIVEEFS